MAMRDLVEGECGTANPLMKLSSHFLQDQAFRQEGLQSRRIDQQNSGFLSIRERETNEFVQEFLSEQYAQSQMAPHSFHMGSLLQEMREIEKTRNPPLTGPPVADIACAETWTDEFLSRELQGKAVGPQEGTWNNEFGPSSGGESMHSSRWASEYLDNPAETQTPAAPDVRDLLDDSKWIDEFKAEDDLNLPNTDSGFMKYMNKMSEEESKEEDGNVLDSDKESNVWAAEYSAQQGPQDAVWNQEFQDVPRAEGNTSSNAFETEADNSFWDNLQKEWEKMGGEDNAEHPWLSGYENIVDPYKEYQFSEDNPLKEHPDPFHEGMKKLEEGDIPSAVLLFEAAVQQYPDFTQAWQYLGTSQAENEQDPAAISALKRCLDLDPTNLTAWMALAVSYTNESMPAQACHALRQWLHNNPRYRHLVPDTGQPAPEPGVSSLIKGNQDEQMRDLYLEAARLNPTDIDADVQCGLGVLFNLSSDYSKAVDCFQAALQVRPKDSLIWNKLGATLANGNRSEEAISAYRQALELSPGFIRSRYNLGVSCINLRAYKEAAEHMLAALNLQAAGRGPQGSGAKSAMSDNIWATMRMIMTLMERHDLYPFIDQRDLGYLNKEFSMDT